MIKAHYTLGIIVLLLFINVGKTTAQTSDSLFMEFYFADGFYNDAVDFKINRSLIFDNQIMNSSPYYSLTGYDLKILEIDKEYSAISSRIGLNKNISIPNPGKVEIRMKVAGISLTETFDQSNGQYVIIYYDSHDKKWVIDQSKVEPGFE